MFELIIAGLFLPAIVLIGLSGARRGSASGDAFFLGDRALPWWALGLSFSASTVDLAGLLASASMFAAVGMGWFTVEMRGVGAIAFAFFAVFIARWHRRSGAVTLADWMVFRFGDTPGGRAARGVNAALVLVLVLAMLTCLGAGFGSLAARWLPGWAWTDGAGREVVGAGAVCTVVFMGAATLQVAFSGLRGAVYAGVLQWVLFAVAAVAVAVAVASTDLDTGAWPAAWSALGHPTQTLSQWHSLWPDGGLPAGARVDPNSPAALLPLFWALLIAVEGFGGPLLPYVNQRFLAARSDRDASLMAALAVAAGAVRWPLVMGLALLTLSRGAAAPADPGALLPAALSGAMSELTRAVVLCSLLGVGTAVFASTLNAGAAYLAHDLWGRRAGPTAPERRQVLAGWLSSLGLGALATGLALVSGPLRPVWCWVTFGGLFGGVALPLALRWYWERFNGWGYALGTAAGVWTAVALALQWPEMSEMASFGLAAAVSLIASVLASLLSAPTDAEVLHTFYARTGPMGWWPRARQATAPERRAQIDAERRRDLGAILPAVGLLLCLFLGPMYALTRDWAGVAASAVGLLACAAALWWSWLRPLIRG